MAAESQIKNILNNEDKSTWDLVSFGDVAREPRESISNLEESQVKRFVGLEHISPKDIHIRSWGDVSDGTTFTRSFKKGQVLFGKRRAYQGKAALADFDGVCSGDILVLEANEEKMEPGLLPFLVHSEGFYNWAVSTSAGSLSPRTKFKDLSRYEFRLPPRLLQKQMVRILWAIDEAESGYIKFCESLKSMKKALFQFFTREAEPKKRLGECLILSKKKSAYPHEEKYYLGLENIDSGAYVTNRSIDAKAVKSTCNIFTKGQLLYSKLRPNLDKAIISSFEGICTTELLVYDAKDNNNLYYILNFLHSDDFIHYATSRSFGTKMPRTSHEIISEYLIYAPTGKEQEEILEQFSKINELEESSKSLLRKINQIKTSIISKGFNK